MLDTDTRELRSKRLDQALVTVEKSGRLGDLSFSTHLFKLPPLNRLASLTFDSLQFALADDALAGTTSPSLATAILATVVATADWKFANTFSKFAIDTGMHPDGRTGTRRAK